MAVAPSKVSSLEAALAALGNHQGPQRKERPEKAQLVHTNAFIERSRLRIQKLDQEREAATEFLNSASQRKARLREQIAADAVVHPAPSDSGVELARLRAKSPSWKPVTAQVIQSESVDAAEALRTRARQAQGDWFRRRRNSQRRTRFTRVDWGKDVGVAGRRRRGRLGVSHTFDKFDFAGCITHEDGTVAVFSVVEQCGFVSTIPAPSPCFSCCLEYATNRRNATVDGFESFEHGGVDVELRCGLRGVRVGEASHPGPPDDTFRDQS